jgi:hypothetical protein
LCKIESKLTVKDRIQTYEYRIAVTFEVLMQDRSFLLKNLYLAAPDSRIAAIPSVIGQKIAFIPNEEYKILFKNISKIITNNKTN